VNEDIPDQTCTTKTTGSELARARQRLSLSLEDIARRTKISVTYLAAIERDQLQQLPGGLYSRAFVRAYAREVGCDPDDIVRRFQLTPEQPAISQLAVEPLRLPVSVDIDDRRTSRYLQMIAIAIIASGGLYAASGHGLHLSILSSKPKIATTAAVATHEAAVSPAPKATSGEIPKETPTAEQTSTAISVDVQTRGECWLSATADGQRLFYRLLTAGEAAHIVANDSIVLRVGDAAAVSLIINGTAGRPLGAAGEPVTIRLTPQNYRDFLNGRITPERTDGKVS
jgi:transcriptional regulator with XRE-family HTH domain